MLYKNYLAQQSGKNKGNGLDGHMGQVIDYSLYPSNFLTVKIYHLDFWGSLSMSWLKLWNKSPEDSVTS